MSPKQFYPYIKCFNNYKQEHQYRFFITTFNINISVFFSYSKKAYPSKPIEIFEKKIYPHEIAKCLCERAVFI